MNQLMRILGWREDCQSVKDKNIYSGRSGIYPIISKFIIIGLFNYNLPSSPTHRQQTW